MSINQKNPTITQQFSVKVSTVIPIHISVIVLLGIYRGCEESSCIYMSKMASYKQNYFAC